MSNCVVPMPIYEKPKTDKGAPKRRNPYADAMTAAKRAGEADTAGAMTLYVAGPISDRDALNKPAFEAARAALASVGYRVVIPHDFVDAHIDWLSAIRATLEALRWVDGVALLDDWQDSDGAQIEALAAMHLSIATLPVEGWLSLAESPDELERVCQNGAKSQTRDGQKLSELFGILSGETENGGAGASLE